MDESELRNGVTNKRIDVHECAQERVLTTICVKLENIEISMAKIEKFQENYAKEIESIKLNSAHYPKPDTVNEYLKKVDAHETRLSDIGRMMWIFAAGILTTATAAVWNHFFR